jgi:hypothetical protein
VIPPFDPATGNLPAGIHEATWEEFAARYGYTVHRRVLLRGLRAAIEALQTAGCQRVYRVYIDGSFVSVKETPGDFDACWEMQGVRLDALDAALKTFDPGRATQKAKYGGELFPADWPADLAGTRFVDFFQRDRATGAAKGIIAIALGGTP